MLIDGKRIDEYRFFQELIALPYIEAVYLTGSRARGDHKERSDIDLAIVCPLASEEEWQKAYTLTRHNEETLLRVDPTRMDQVTDPGQRKIIMHKRQLLFLRTYGGDNIILQRQIEFFNIWHEKLLGWCLALPVQVDHPTGDDLRKSLNVFHTSFDCIWVIVRKCLSIHGMHTNTPISTFREAYMEGWLSERLLWEQMVDDYRETRASTDEALLISAYRRIPSYMKTMQQASMDILAIVKPYSYANANSYANAAL